MKLLDFLSVEISFLVSYLKLFEVGCVLLSYSDSLDTFFLDLFVAFQPFWAVPGFSYP